jgi:chloramphenicol O-acetyltransferase type A
MRHIQIETWARREHFRVYCAFDHPHFGLCANVDLTTFYPFVKQRGYSINVAIVYVIARVANAIPEFRYRIRATDVVEHEVVHPSTTIMTGEDLFSFCYLEYREKFSEFASGAQERIAQVQKHLCLEDPPGQDDLLFMTAIPWVSFTSFLHPVHLQPPDSIPRFAWGKFFQNGDSLSMPLGVQVHHALMDGLHVGRFYIAVQEALDHPGFVLGDG